MPQITDMQGLLEYGLQELYAAEQEAVKAYPQFIDAASTQELKQSLQQHEQRTQEQIQRLQQCAQQMGFSAEGSASAAVQGLITDTQKLIQSIEAGPIRDAALIGAAQKIEHLEIAAYGTARTLAQQSGQQQAAQMFAQTLQEEKETDEKLSQLAESDVNLQAAGV